MNSRIVQVIRRVFGDDSVCHGCCGKGVGERTLRPQNEGGEAMRFLDKCTLCDGEGVDLAVLIERLEPVLAMLVKAHERQKACKHGPWVRGRCQQCDAFLSDVKAQRALLLAKEEVARQSDGAATEDPPA